MAANQRSRLYFNGEAFEQLRQDDLPFMQEANHDWRVITEAQKDINHKRAQPWRLAAKEKVLEEFGKYLPCSEEICNGPGEVSIILARDDH